LAGFEGEGASIDVFVLKSERALLQAPLEKLACEVGSRVPRNGAVAVGEVFCPLTVVGALGGLGGEVTEVVASAV